MEPRGLRDKLGGLVVLVVLVSTSLVVNVSGNLVFPVSHKFNGRRRASLSELKAHDDRRHARFLAATENAIDVVLGGNGHPSEYGLYYAKLGIGNPSHDYYVHVDTGSDIFWVSCVECGNDCPTNTEIKGVSITLYDRKSSSTSKVVTCGDNFCNVLNKDSQSNCTADETCKYRIAYGDGETDSGYYVRDDVQFQKATGDLQTSSTSGSVVFGCTTKKTGGLNNSATVTSGLIGFGQANSSMLSQLVAAGKVRNKFAHCLDSTRQGGGIWAIGEVVEPKLKNTTPLVPNQQHYNVVLEKIEVGSDDIKLPGGGVLDSLFSSSSNQVTAIFDSGTTLAYVPEEVQEQIVQKIFAKEPGLKLQTSEDSQYECFDFSKNVDETFPVVKFHFKNSASLWVYPHDYMFTLKKDTWCIGWMKSRPGSKDSILLGDMILSNKVIVYDLEKQVIGWTDHNCSSSIKVKDDQSGSDYSIQYHNLAASSSDDSSPRLLMSFLFLVTAAAAAML
ncbi:aspartic proteinase 36 [Argentina anserina]|uniref:aspartic proteinase 36 n=1 Tax=Argentina anserina TaxID=57926 RepID=UPI00217679A3|nr:aspartic proteinase 36 [Potentilla anserina]